MNYDDKALWCKTCSPHGAVDVHHKKCGGDGCETRATFAMSYGDTPGWCSSCAPNGAMDVVSKRCPGKDGKGCPKNTRVCDKELCLKCDDTRVSREKKYEIEVFDILDTLYDIEQQRYVRFISTKTGRCFARVDGVINCDNITICIEVDERKHSAYDKNYDSERMKLVNAELRIKYHNRLISWVRVNPTVKGMSLQFTQEAKARRKEIVDEASRTIRELILKPSDCVKYINF